MIKSNPNTTRTELQGVQQKNSRPLSDRPIAAALLHAGDAILYLRRAMLATHGRRARSINRLIEGQRTIFEEIRYLCAVESAGLLEESPYGDEHIASIVGDELTALAVERAVGSGVD